MRKGRPRIQSGLLRGGLGRLGWIPSLGSFGFAWLARADIAMWVCVLAAPLFVWCAIGLRKDDSAGELSDHYVDEESLDWKELLSGNFEHPVRRQSNAMIAIGLLACVIAWSRWRFGWGPFV